MPTALELGPKGWKPYIEAARKRPAPRQASPFDEKVREQLLVRIHKVADALKKRLGARRVVLFGSLAHEAWFMPDSDVDLVVEGLQGEIFWQAWRLAEEIIDDRPVDLIEIESVGESMQKAIARYGVEL
jgi:predicted nucleotidyltransferase